MYSPRLCVSAVKFFLCDYNLHVRINVRFFAILKDRTGESGTSLELPRDSTVATAIESVAKQFPDLARDCNRIAFAVNRSYVKSDYILTEGDELALIPPVSGG
jgi:molybdopterin synthase catalytic subunit